MIIEHEPLAAGRAATPRIDAVEKILRRYPHVSEAELAHAEDFLANAPFLDRGQLSARDGMQVRMEQFRRDRPKAFRASPISYAIAALIAVTVIALSILIAG